MTVPAFLEGGTQRILVRGKINTNLGFALFFVLFSTAYQMGDGIAKLV
jgi:hypothetical protein